MSSLPQEKQKEVKNNTGRYQISYESYIDDWKNLGTTLPNLEDKDNPVHNHILVPSGEKRTVNDVENNFLESSTRKIKQKECKVNQLKATRLQLLKDIHSNKRGGMDMKMVLPESSDEFNFDEDLEEINSAEVNNLVSWTEKLPDD